LSTFRLPLGCLIWYDFATQKDTTVYDLSGNDNNGTIYDAKWKKGPIMGALNFDGVNDYVTHPFVGLSGIPDLTIEMLVKVLEAPSVRYWYYAYGYNAKNRGFHILWDEGAGFWRIGWWGGVQIKPTNPHWGKWLHLVMVNSSTEMKLRVFFNGKLQGEVALSGAEDLSETNMRHIAYPFLAGEDYLKGDVALFRLYNRALTEKEVEAHYWYAKTAVKVPV